MQGHQVEKEKQNSFCAGENDKPLNVIVETSSGATIRGEGSKTDGKEVQVSVHLKRMSPIDTEQLQENARDLTYRNFTMGRPYDARKARIADLRDAYLWVFARFGYSAVANTLCDWIREAIETGVAQHNKWADDIENSPAEEFLKKAGKQLIFIYQNLQIPC